MLADAEVGRKAIIASVINAKFNDAVGLIIAEGLRTDGLYFHSKSGERCLRLQVIEPAEAPGKRPGDSSADDN